jgi:hypothetical protein
MQLKSTYQKDKYLTVICEDFDPTETSCQKLQQMLESAKFTLASSWQWQRQEFNETPKGSFEFWLSQVIKLCTKYGIEPVEVSEEMPTDSKIQGALLHDSILTQLALLKEEIANLKKFDCTANEKLQHLRELLQQREVGRRK